MCMCGMLATEALTLDAHMLPKLQQFFTHNTEWLAQLLSEGLARGTLVFEGSAADQARAVLALLQGASLVCRSSGDLAAFDRTVAILIDGFLRKG